MSLRVKYYKSSELAVIGDGTPGRRVLLKDYNNSNVPGDSLYRLTWCRGIIIDAATRTDVVRVRDLILPGQPIVWLSISGRQYYQKLGKWKASVRLKANKP